MQNKRARWGWILYEGAAPFLLVVMIEAGYLESMISTVLIMTVLSPFIGTLGDGKGRKKKEFLICLLAGFLGTVSAAWTGLPAMFVLALLCFSATELLHSAFLTDVSDMERIKGLSALGSLCFLAGSVICLWIVPMLLKPALDFRVTTGVAVLWVLAFSIPFLICVRHRHEALSSNVPLPVEVLRTIRKTAVSMAKNRKIRSLVIAAFFCTVGICTVLMQGAFRISLHIKSIWWVVPAALLCTIVSSRWSGIQTLLAGLSLSALGCLMDLLLPGSALVIISVTCCGIRALVRACFARIIPRDQSAAYFGILYCLGYMGILLGVGLSFIPFANILACASFLVSGSILLYQRRRLTHAL
ncbi:MAG: MFS transporter [Firmicutes bacterium]|nr:MFS transporter [Bacillota bacterium]